MNFAQALDIALPLAAVMIPGFVLGFGAICLAMHNGFAQIRGEIADVRSEIADLRKELHSLSERVRALVERVSRIEGRLDPYGPGGLADPGLPAGE